MGEPENGAATAQVMASGRKRGIRWTKTMKERFLDHLAATCHVTGAAEAIGVPLTTVYALRRRDRAFATAWGEALALGYEMLETKVVGHALAGGGRLITNGATDGGDAGGDEGGVDVDLALTLLTTHRNAMQGKPLKGGRQPRVATREETNAAILKKLRLVEEGLRRTAAREAAAAGKTSVVLEGVAEVVMLAAPAPAKPAEAA